MSRAGLGDLTIISGGWGWREGAHLLQKTWRGEGGDNSIGHGRADPVELPDLPPPGAPQPCAVSCHSCTCHPARSCAEGNGPALLEMPKDSKVQRGFWRLPRS